MRFKKILISAVAALMGMTVLTSCGERSELRLGTGNPGGIYYAYGTTLHELDEAGVTVKKTEGSMANKPHKNNRSPVPLAGKNF